MLSRVAHVVPFAPGVLPAAGMTYVSLICAARGSARSERKRDTKMYLEAFTVKPFRVPATMGTAGTGGGIPAFEGRRMKKAKGEGGRFRGGLRGIRTN